MNKNILYGLAQVLAGFSLAAPPYVTEDKPHGVAPQPPKVTCKECYFFTGGSYCKKVKHSVNKFTPANGCAYFKRK